MSTKIVFFFLMVSKFCVCVNGDDLSSNIYELKITVKSLLKR